MAHITEHFLIDIDPAFLFDPWRGARQSEGVPPTPPAPTAEWITGILRTFTKIAMSDAGVALLKSIKSSGRWIVVVPLGEERKCNAHGEAFGELIHNGRRYTGIVKFDPARYSEGSACYKHLDLANARVNRGARPDEVLYHELIHAHRFALRLRNSTQLAPGLKRHTSVEEFLAIVITNVYISDVTNRDKSGLRRDHVGKNSLERVLSDSLGFFASSSQVLPLLQEFRKEQTTLFDALADVVAEFNPFYAMKHFEAEIQRMSPQIANQRAICIPKEKVVMKKPIPPPTAEQMKSAFSDLARQALAVLQRFD